MKILFGIEVSTKMAGRVSVWWGRGTWAVHLLPRKGFRSWGLTEDWHDGPMYDFGVGPLVLVSWMG